MQLYSWQTCLLTVLQAIYTALLLQDIIAVCGGERSDATG